MSSGRTRRVNPDPSEPIPWRVLQDKRISFRARGVLGYLLSLPDGWEASAERIARDTTEGRDAVATALKELESVGYLARRKYQTTGGTWAWAWLYSDTPDELAAHVEDELRAAGAATVHWETVDGFPVDGPTSGNTTSPQVEPSTGKPNTENQGTKKVLLTQRTEDTDKDSPSEPPAAVRDDVEALCTRLRDRMIANGCKEPTITKAWRDEARRLLDRDGRELDKALNLIDWCQQDTFWRSNIHSMPTFRKQYDKLRQRANDEYRQQRGSNGYTSPTDERIAAFLNGPSITERFASAWPTDDVPQLGQAELLALPGGDWR